MRRMLYGGRFWRKKYLTPYRLVSKEEDKLPCSENWVAIRKGRDIFEAGSRWVLGRESNLNFWENNWLPSSPISGSVQGPLPLQEANLQVKDVVSTNGWIGKPFQWLFLPIFSWN